MINIYSNQKQVFILLSVVVCTCFFMAGCDSEILVFSPDPDTYTEIINVSIEGSDEAIYYSLNDSDPVQNGQIYRGPIKIDSTCTLYASTEDEDTLISGNYIINLPAEEPTAWTIGIYFAGANNLESYLLYDLNEIEEGLSQAITNGNDNIMNEMSVVSLIDRISAYAENGFEEGESDWTGSRLYHMQPDTGSSLASIHLDDGGSGDHHISPLPEQNMGDPYTLAWFLTYLKAQFPAEKTAVILWDHGDGARAADPLIQDLLVRGIAEDNESGDYLYLDEVQQALDQGWGTGNKISVVGFDACLMGTVEVAYELRNYADYMVGSMHTEQGYGWDYKSLIGSLYGDDDTGVLDGKRFCELQVSSYGDYIENYYLANSGETQSAVDLSKIGALKTTLDSFAAAIAAAYGSDSSVKSTIEGCRDNAVHFYENDVDSLSFPYFDIYDFCINVEGETSLGLSVRNASSAVRTALADAVLAAYSANGISEPSGTSFMGYNQTGADAVRGLSVFFSRGDLSYISGNESYSHYAYQWWYTDENMIELLGVEWNYGCIDFADSDSDGEVETWRELMELFYDSSNEYTYGSY